MKRFVYLNPLSFLIIVAFVLLLILLIPLLFLGIVGGALSKLGFGFAGVVLILAATIIGSFFNIPVAKIKSGPKIIRVPHGQLGGGHYRPGAFDEGITVVAVNVGGAVVPVLVSAYLLFGLFSGNGSFEYLYSALFGILVLAVVTYFTSRNVPGVGIGVPLLIPPLAALICGLVLSFGVVGIAPVIAYVSGTLGTLLGADLLNLKKMVASGADIMSIGGAGTFDGIFLTGIIAALLA